MVVNGVIWLVDGMCGIGGEEEMGQGANEAPPCKCVTSGVLRFCPKLKSDLTCPCKVDG